MTNRSLIIVYLDRRDSKDWRWMNVSYQYIHSIHERAILCVAHNHRTRFVTLTYNEIVIPMYTYKHKLAPLFKLSLAVFF